MSDLAINGDRRMTVREVSEALGVDPEAIKKHARELFPEILRNGYTTYLNERQVTEIKRRMRPTTEVVGAVTAIEIEEMTIKVLAYHKAESDRLRADLAAAAPKIALADAIGRSDRSMSITDAAKHFGLHPKVEVFPYLRARGYLTLSNLPTQQALDAGYLALREVAAQDGKVYPQAVVEAWQLENWRAHVVHQVKRWVHDQAKAFA
jgi:phage antirepressor YoqD-like protein